MVQQDKDRLRERLFDKIFKEGVWAILFVVLLLYVMHDSREREVKYQETIKILSATLATDIRNISTELNDLKNLMQRR